MRSLDELMDLAGRSVLVTGAAGHVGRLAVETLLELGARVIGADLADTLEGPAVDELTRRHGSDRLGWLACDLEDEHAAREAVRRTVAETGGLQVLVHCASPVGDSRLEGWAAPFDRQTVAPWDLALRVNLISAFVLAQEAFPHLARQRGAIVLVSSIYGLVGPMPDLYQDTGVGHPAAYDAAKGGLLQLSRYLATTLAPRVRVNSISPGGIERDQPRAFRDLYEPRVPLGRMATEEDLKGAFAYLASDLSSYVTGQNLIVDGGWTIQ